MEDFLKVVYGVLIGKRVSLHLVSLLFGILLFANSSTSLGQTVVDVQAEVNRSLQSVGMVVKKRTIQRVERECRDVVGCKGECTRSICHDIPISVQENFQDYLHLTSISVTKISKLDFGKPFVNSVPERFELDNFRVKNCADTPQTANTALQKSVQISRSITISHTISTTNVLTAGLSFSFAGFGSGNASVSVTKTISLTDTNAQTESESVARSFNINQAVPPLTELWGELRIVQSNLLVPFTASVIVDGPVDANESGYANASQALSEPQRTFVISGTLFATAASDAIVTFFSRHLDKTVDCVGNNKFETAAFDGSARLLPMIKKPSVEDPSAKGFAPTAAGTATAQQPFFTLPALPLSVLGNRASETNIFPRRSGKTKGFSQDTPSFSAAGQHQCQSETDIGHTCQVSGVGYNDCNEAFFQLKASDCCASTRICGPDPNTGTIKCQLGGTSIGFTVNYCIPM